MRKIDRWVLTAGQGIGSEFTFSPGVSLHWREVRNSFLKAARELEDLRQQPSDSQPNDDHGPLVQGGVNPEAGPTGTPAYDVDG